MWKSCPPLPPQPPVLRGSRPRIVPSDHKWGFVFPRQRTRSLPPTWARVCLSCPSLGLGRDGATGGELRSRDRQVCGARRGVCPWFGGGLGAERQYVGRDEAAVLGTVGRKEVRNNTTIIAAREARFQPRRGTEFCLTQRVCFKSFLRAKRCGRHGMNQTLSLTFKR